MVTLCLRLINQSTYHFFSSLKHYSAFMGIAICLLMLASTSAYGLDTSTQTIQVKKGDSLYSIFKSNHIPQQQLQRILALGETAKSLKNLNIGRQITVETSKENNLQRLSYETSARDTLMIRRDDQGDFFTQNIHQEIPTQLKNISGTFHHSLYQDTVAAGLPVKLVQPLADLFTWKVSLTKSLRDGDTFRIIFEHGNDKNNAADAIAAAEIIHRGETLQAFCYHPEAKQKGQCYGPNGESLTPQFSRYPVKYTHISDHFNPKRKHPILHIIRPHWGVDFAAKKGTPIRATADGTITYMARKGGFGRFIEIDHNKGITTRYAHLSRYHKNLKKGSAVKRNQIIGYVGKSGLSTGSHLHYEYRVHGKAKNPLKVELPQGNALSQKEMTAFLAYKDKIWQS